MRTPIMRLLSCSHFGVITILLATSPNSAQAQFSGIQMPVAGNVTIEYDSAYTLSFPIPSASHVTVKIANRTKPDTSVTGRLRSQQTGTELWCPCTGPGESAGCDPRTWYRYRRDTTHAPSEWKFPVGSVLPDEQVQLACSTLAPNGQAIGTDFSGSGGPDTVGQTLVWKRYFETSFIWYCDPSYKFVQRVYISLVLSPDTVVRFGTLDSNNVYPYYPTIRNDTVTTGRFKRFVDLEARIAYGDSILRNYSIRVEKPLLVDSGGHSHNGTRPLATYRIPKVSGGGFDTVNTFFVRKTDTSGVLKFRFLASQFGGAERIKARTVSDTTKFDTISLATRVPGLQLLPSGTNYIKYGGTCSHHGPQAPSGCTTPDADHWGTAGIVQGIIAIADSFAAYYPNFKIRINDMSLPSGGGFDVGGNWIADIIDEYPQSGDCNDVGHCEHRTGAVADISFSVVNPSGQVVPMTPDQREDMWGIIEDVVGEPLEHGHYHIGQE